MVIVVYLFLVIMKSFHCRLFIQIVSIMCVYMCNNYLFRCTFVELLLPESYFYSYINPKSSVKLEGSMKDFQITKKENTSCCRLVLILQTFFFCDVSFVSYRLLRIVLFQIYLIFNISIFFACISSLWLLSTSNVLIM